MIAAHAGRRAALLTATGEGARHAGGAVGRQETARPLVEPGCGGLPQVLARPEDVRRLLDHGALLARGLHQDVDFSADHRNPPSLAAGRDGETGLPSRRAARLA